MTIHVQHLARIALSLAAALVLAPNLFAHAAAAAPQLDFQVVGRIGVPLGSVEWTGSRFVFSAEGKATLYAADATMRHISTFASVPKNNGEMRCILSSAAHGFPAGSIYCHAAQGPIYRISGDGKHVSQFAVIPGPQASDGALAFDTVGAFGYALLAATGGSDAGSGGAVFAVSATGQVRRIGAYGGPGGAENALVAPASFGTVGGEVLLAIDKHDHLGRLLAMNAHGTVRTLVTGLQYGLNPMTMIPQQSTTAGAAGPPAGLYLADWLSHDVFFASATELGSLAGDLFVGTERRGHLYMLHAQGDTYTLVTLQTNLHAADYNFEGARYVS